MALEGCQACIKYLMFIFNCLFWLLGCALIGIGIYIRLDKNFEHFQSFFIFIGTGSYILIALGVVVFILGFLGCCGAIKENACMLGVFFVALFLLFCALLGIGIFSMVAKGEMRTLVEKALKDQTDEGCKMKPNVDARKFMKAIQEEFNCCGATDYSDYMTNCDNKIPPCNGTAVVTPKKGCTDGFYEFLTSKALIIGGITMGVAVVLIFGLIFSIVLCCAVRRGEGYSG